MTYKLLTKIIEENNIPQDFKLMSDSGWECGETEMDGIFYNKEKNVLIFTQEGNKYDGWHLKDGWVCVYGKLKDFKDEHGFDFYECYNDSCISNVDNVCYRKDRRVSTCKYM